MSENIILIGFMGTGKDTIGRLLADKLNRPFLSTDEMIELTEKKSIKQIFEENGERYFRKREKWVVEKIRDIRNTVIATGGGIVIDPQNRALLKNSGIVIHLFADLKTLRRRIAVKNQRPLIRRISDIERLYKDRKNLYDFARLEIDTSSRPPEVIANEIIENLKLHGFKHFLPQKKILVKTKSKNYPVIIGFDIAGILPFERKKIVIITNPLVGALYLNEFANYLKRKGNQVHYIIIPDGERYKSLETVKMIFNYLFSINFQRQDIIISLGGGVITDIAGFVASIFKRGCELVHAPTTLLGQVDAAIGGKTGINTANGKNMLGSFYQPELVVCDIKKLFTLSEFEFRNGIAEVIKYAIIGSLELFTVLQQERKRILARDPQILYRIIEQCISIKASVVYRDETETKGLREILNFGHTIGHVVETASGYRKYSHGEAVAMGMIEEMRIFNNASKDLDTVVKLVRDYFLPFLLPEKLRKRIKNLFPQDKKMKGSRITMPILEKIGKVKTKEVLCKEYF
ncbi:MAG: 3-dehydroquinate synthase [candidate division WOR-3 bacterium]